jgi:hypothetical protein
MKLSAINASTRGVSAELIVELNGVYYEAVRFGIGDDAVDVAARLRHMAARIEYRTSRTPAPGVAERHPRCGYPYCACVGQCFAASQPGAADGVKGRR